MEDRHLCKAKRKDTGEWVEGYMIPRKYEGTDKIFEAHIVVDAYEQIGVFNMRRALVSEVGYECFVVDPSTICKCTGLHDKNGKLIWENDILMCHGNQKELVKAVFGEFTVINAETLEKIDNVIGWHYEVIPTDALSKCEPFCLSMPLTEEYVKTCEFEVICSAFDNMELLEAGKEAGEQGSQDVLMPAT